MNKCPYLLFHFSILMVRRRKAAKRTGDHKGLPYYTRPASHAQALYSREAPCGRPLVHIALLFRSYALSGPYKVVFDEIWYEVEGGSEGSFVFAPTLRRFWATPTLASK